MLQQNVEAIQRIVDAFNLGDPDAFVACCSPDVDWEENSPAYPGLRPHYRGLKEVREWFEEAILEVWEGFHVEPDLEVVVEGAEGQVLFPAVITGRGKSSGVDTRLPVWTVFWLERGKVKRRQNFLDRTAAFESIGVSE
jgi:ketosteroid isomerase-like protein